MPTQHVDEGIANKNVHEDQHYKLDQVHHSLSNLPDCHVARVFSLPDLRVQSLLVDFVLEAVSLAKWHERQKVHEALADQKLKESHNHDQIGHDRNLLGSEKDIF